MEHTPPTFKDIKNLIQEIAIIPTLNFRSDDPTKYLTRWLSHYSKNLDFSRGFLINRCALYWAGYDANDGFDGQQFVDSCQNKNGSLRQLAQILDTDLQIFELDPHNHTKADSYSITMAASYGMMAIEESTQMFCATSFGQGVESTAINAIESLNTYKSLEEYMLNYCGLDHAAMLGATIAGLLKGIPIILEGNSGKLIKKIIEKETKKSFNSIILTQDLNIPVDQIIPGQKMIMTAIILKTIFTEQYKTDTGTSKAVI